MNRFWCVECKKPISTGVFDYSIDVYRKPLCRECQERIQRYLDIRSGKLKIEYEKISKCVRCGKELSGENTKRVHCDSCNKEISNMKNDNPFSPLNKRGTSKFRDGIDSDHYD
jgi:DNA-directed RNA polymerase subunit RPC12/RpoP